MSPPRSALRSTLPSSRSLSDAEIYYEIYSPLKLGFLLSSRRRNFQGRHSLILGITLKRNLRSWKSSLNLFPIGALCGQMMDCILLLKQVHCT